MKCCQLIPYWFTYLYRKQNHLINFASMSKKEKKTEQKNRQKGQKQTEISKNYYIKILYALRYTIICPSALREVELRNRLMSFRILQ